MTVIATIVGSAFEEGIEGFTLTPTLIESEHGVFEFHRVEEITDRQAWVIFRHASPHKFLPNQINYRAMIGGLKTIACQALLTTTSVGVMDLRVPLFEPLLVDDLIMLENRLPDGSACTMFLNPSKEQGHLVVKEGLFSNALSDQIRNQSQLKKVEGIEELTFIYVGGPRTKTAAENKWLAGQVAQINSMTFAPEVILANELEIPVAGIAIGHKYSNHTSAQPEDSASVAESLVLSRKATDRVVKNFLQFGQPVKFANHIYRFEAHHDG